jgi:hypothetical protein
MNRIHNKAPPDAIPPRICLGVFPRSGLENAVNFLHDDWVPKRILAHLRPILPVATVDHIVDPGQGVLLVIQMSVLHTFSPP